MRTTISIQGKDYRVAITPQTIVYVAKASGKFSLKTLQDENALKELFEQMDLPMMEGLLYASLETGAYLDKKELELEEGARTLADLIAPYSEQTHNILLAVITEGGPEEVTEQFYNLIESMELAEADEEEEEDEEEGEEEEDKDEKPKKADFDSDEEFEKALKKWEEENEEDDEEEEDEEEADEDFDEYNGSYIEEDSEEETKEEKRANDLRDRIRSLAE